MSSSFDTFLPSWEEIEADKQWTYEQVVVKYIINKIGRPDLQKAIEGAALVPAEDTQPLTFYNLMQVCNFPMWLGTKKLGIHPCLKCGQTDLESQIYHRYTTTALWKAFLDVVHDVPPEFEGRPVGMVFNWPTKAKYMLLHNSARHPVRGHFQGFFAGPQQILHHIEDLDNFIFGLGPPEEW
jgi:hypothetical protein